MAVDLHGPDEAPTPLEAYRISVLNLPGLTRESYGELFGAPAATVPPTAPTAPPAAGPGLGVLVVIALLIWLGG